MLKYHYVYRITNLLKNKHYYGIRTTKYKPESDLGKRYFSSSKDQGFIKDQKKNSQNYRYKIIFVYNNRESAIRMEIKLHNKFNVGISESFYNKAKQTSVGFDRSGVTYKHSDETKYKIGIAHKNKFVSKDTREKLSLIHKGKTITKKHKEQISDALTGKRFTDEHKNKISDALTGLPKPTYTCPHCGKIGKSGVMKRWHFDNCSSIN